jgi:hypothetical protein
MGIECLKIGPPGGGQRTEEGNKIYYWQRRKLEASDSSPVHYLSA